jgi:adenylate cyclase
VASASGFARLSSRQGAVIGLVAGAFLALLGGFGLFELLDLRIHDLRYKLRGPQPGSPRLAVVEVDDATVSQYGAWPLPRSAYALLEDVLETAGARVIGFDMLFLGSNPRKSDDPRGDMLLAAVTSRHTNIVHAISFLSEQSSVGEGAGANEYDDPLLERHGRPVARQTLALGRRAATPDAELLRAADALGHTSVVVDRDGVVRRIPLFVRYGDWAYPSLAIRLVECAARGDSSMPQFELAEDGVLLHGPHGPHRVPLDATGATPIVYAGDRASFPQTYSMLDVLNHSVHGDTAWVGQRFRDKIVLVGVTAVGEVVADVGATPFAEATPLVWVHANAINAAIQARFLNRPSALGVAFVLWLLGPLLGAAYARMSLGRSALLAGGLLAGMAAFNMLAFLVFNTDVPMAALFLLPPATWMGVQGFLRRATDRESRMRERELGVARTIQQNLLPKRPPELPDLEMCGTNLPAEAVGGDYFDWRPLGEDQYAVALGDVSGHGVPASILMSHLRASFHSEARPGRSASEIVTSMHESLVDGITSGRFATFFLAVVSRRENRMQYCNAGHNPPYIVRGGKVERLGATGLPLAMLDPCPPFTDVECDFLPGDLLLIYSDGIPEAPIRGGMYGEERLEAKAIELASAPRPLGEIMEKLLVDVRNLSGAKLATDDVTLVLLRRR